MIFLGTVPAVEYDLARSWEKLRLKAYYDSARYPTQGWGHLLSRIKDEDLGKYPDWTKSRADDTLEEDLEKEVAAVRRLCPVELTAGRYGALIDFAFNCGSGNLQASALRQMVLRSDWVGASGQFSRWVYSGGRYTPGLVPRRQQEREMFDG